MLTHFRVISCCFLFPLKSLTFVLNKGNEEDYIILSLVRSRDQGFLKSLRRTNVMLTRFKQGMFVVSSKKFLAGAGRDCLAGEIAAKIGSRAWLGTDDIAKGNFFGPRKNLK